jgi:uncharacterized protein (DUF342 family)
MVVSMTEKKSPKTKKILEPSFHFATGKIQIGDDVENKVTVSELVPANHILADFPNFKRLEPKGYEKATILCGDNTCFSEDGESILSLVPGYPKIISGPGNNAEDQVVISVEPLFILSPDKMKVTLAVHPPLPDCRSLQNVDLSELLESASIVFGLDEKQLKKAREFIRSGEPEFSKFVIARGRPVGESSDAYLRYELEIGPIAGTLLEDGSIDFRDRRIMVGINKGQCIATKIPPVQGTPGVNVFGEETPAPEGKDIKINTLNDAKFSPETLQVTATKDGVLSIVNGNVIKVCSKQVINSDIDYKTGNVDSRNCVTVRGSVQPGFKVTADGDLEITGNVMSTSIKGLGNIVVKGGITGKKTIIEALGDCDINFIEQGKIKCGGLCVIRKQSYYSIIHSGSHIRCKPGSTVISGNLVAAGNLTAGNIGAENSKSALIAAGVVAERLLHYEELKLSVIEQQDAIIQWLQLYRGSSTSRKVRKMEKELADTKARLLRVNMIPGTGIYSKAGENERDPELAGSDYDDRGAINIDKIRIDVLGTVFAGTEIRIGNRSLKLDKTVSKRQFRLHASRRRIIAKPIR